MPRKITFGKNCQKISMKTDENVTESNFARDFVSFIQMSPVLTD